MCIFSGVSNYTEIAEWWVDPRTAQVGHGSTQARAVMGCSHEEIASMRLLYFAHGTNQTRTDFDGTLKIFKLKTGKGNDTVVCKMTVCSIVAQTVHKFYIKVHPNWCKLFYDCYYIHAKAKFTSKTRRLFFSSSICSISIQWSNVSFQ